MAIRAHARRASASANIWPGFVDALATLLIIILFLLLVFTLAQFFLGELLSGRNAELDRLNRQVAELGEVLALERASGEKLQAEIARLSGALSAAETARDQLAAELQDARGTIAATQSALDRQGAMIVSLNADIAALRELRDELEKKIGALAARAGEAETALLAARDRSKALEARLASEQERTALAQKEIEAGAVKLEDAIKRTGAAEAEVARLNSQIAALRQQLSRLAAALQASEAKSAEQQIEIVNLGKRLNAALATKVAELARYRSEFFGRLRAVLGAREDVRIEGDRFVFQSEVLFDSGSDTLKPDGKLQIARLAATLREIAATIPNDLDWVLRVDGHTDKLPIQTGRFPSNWELSTARAISVVKFLITEGVPPHRLAATGFGEFRPLDTRGDEIAYRRNRRIELKLTNR